MAFTANDVKVLRERTSCGMMDCKKALTEADGDMEKAIDALKEKGLAAAAKKAGRIAAEGIVVSIVDEAKKVGVVLEVNAETDFVAKNESFVTFVNDIAKTIIDENPADVDTLMSMKLSGSDMTVQEALTEKIQKIGENMKIRRFERLEGDLVSYIHGGGRIASMIKFDTDVASKDGFIDYAKDIAMQVAAVTPQYLAESDVPSEIVEKEKSDMLAQIANDEKTKNKPQQVVEKMIEGKIRKFFKEICLVDQQYVKDGEKTIKSFTEETAKSLGGSITIVKFIRFEKGEGIAKREENFADEVASMMK